MKRPEDTLARKQKSTEPVVGTQAGGQHSGNSDRGLTIILSIVSKSRTKQLVRQLKTFIDALNMPALDLEEEDVKTEFYKVIRHVSKELIDDKRIREVNTKYASEAVCTNDNVDSIASKMATTFLDSPSVIYVMVIRLQLQSNHGSHWPWNIPKIASQWRGKTMPT